MSCKRGNIALIGFMGSGKSTVGRMLAGKLDKTFIDIDHIIELAEENSINGIFSLHGEEYFRNIESKVIKKVFKNNNCVYACGGGVVIKKENMAVIKKNSLVIYLKITPDCAFKRLEKDKSRPLIKDGGKDIINSLIEEREREYIRYSDHMVDSEPNDPEAICGNIIKKIGHI